MSFLKERMPIVLEVSAALVNVLSLTGNPMAMRAATILRGCVGVASALCSPPTTSGGQQDSEGSRAEGAKDQDG